MQGCIAPGIKVQEECKALVAKMDSLSLCGAVHMARQSRVVLELQVESSWMNVSKARTAKASARGTKKEMRHRHYTPSKFMRRSGMVRYSTFHYLFQTYHANSITSLARTQTKVVRRQSCSGKPKIAISDR